MLESRAPPFLQRFVPMAAVAAANCVNVPLMRNAELNAGVQLRDEKGQLACHSRTAALKGISQVVLSRNAIMAPGMILLPFIMQRMEKKAWFAKVPALHAPFQVMAVGCFLTFMVPAGCAIFPQTCSIEVEALKSADPKAYQELLKR